MDWVRAKLLLDRMLDRADTTYPVMRLPLRAQAEAVLAAVRRVEQLEAALEPRVAYVVVHKQTGRAVLGYVGGEMLEFWKEQEYETRFAALGYTLCRVNDLMPLDAIARALENLEDD
jgi:hypothetical protein